MSTFNLSDKEHNKMDLASGFQEGDERGTIKGGMTGRQKT